MDRDLLALPIQVRQTELGNLLVTQSMSVGDQQQRVITARYFSSALKHIEKLGFVQVLQIVGCYGLLRFGLFEHGPPLLSLVYIHVHFAVPFRRENCSDFCSDPTIKPIHPAASSHISRTKLRFVFSIECLKMRDLQEIVSLSWAQEAPGSNPGARAFRPYVSLRFSISAMQD